MPHPATLARLTALIAQGNGAGYCCGCITAVTGLADCRAPQVCPHCGERKAFRAEMLLEAFLARALRVLSVENAGGNPANN